MVRFRLRADQGAIQSQVNLFDDGVRQIVGDPEFVDSRYVAPIALFQPQMHGELAAIQIHMVVQRGNDEFHGVDARGGGLDGHHAIGIDADVCGGDLEYLQRGADDFGGLGVGGLWRVDVEKEFFQRHRRPRLFRLDGAARCAVGFLYRPRHQDNRCTNSNSGIRFTLAANHPPY